MNGMHDISPPHFPLPGERISRRESLGQVALCALPAAIVAVVGGIAIKMLRLLRQREPSSEATKKE